jgi:hypothetical protein
VGDADRADHLTAGRGMSRRAEREGEESYDDETEE